MNEPRVVESVTNECQSLGRAHESSSARAEQLIACLEGEIAKRDARILELEADLAGTQSRVLVLQDQWRQIDAELAAIKAQSEECPAYKSVKAVEVSHPSFGVVDYARDAAPVSEAKAQGVVMPERKTKADYGVYIDEFADEAAAIYNAALDAVARLNAAPVQQASVPDAGKLADAFMSWKLPASVRPDGCAMDTTYPHRYGTNLLTWVQAKEMFEYVLAHPQKEHLDSVRNLKARIADLAERLPYADGQSHYDDKRKIEVLTAELFQLESRP